MQVTPHTQAELLRLMCLAQTAHMAVSLQGLRPAVQVSCSGLDACVLMESMKRKLWVLIAQADICLGWTC